MFDKRKIRVCFFSPGSYIYFHKNNESQYGGAELQMYLLATRLSESAHFSVDVLIGNHGQPNTENYGNIRLIKSFNLPKHESLSSKLLKTLKLIFILLRLKPNVILTTSPNAIAGIISFIKKIMHFKHIHRTASLVEIDKSWIDKNGISGKLFYYGFKHANLIICQNSEHSRLIKENFNIEPKILKNAFNIQEQQVQKKNCILWVGRFDFLKQAHIFVSIAQQMPQFSFKMICSHEYSEEKKWKQFFTYAKEVSNLELIEQIAFDEIQTEFNNASLLINTSISEGFPNTFLQAAAGKTPVVTLNVNPDNYLTEYNCGVFCKNDPDFMIKTIKDLLSDREKMDEMGKNGYNYLVKNHDIRLITNQLAKLIENLA